VGIGQQPADTTLSQTGLVPIDSKSLVFKVHPDLQLSGSFAVVLGGQTLSLTTLGAGTNYTEYAADIHAWAGQTAELDFTVFASGRMSATTTSTWTQLSSLLRQFPNRASLPFRSGHSAFDLALSASTLTIQVAGSRSGPSTSGGA
jgi:hypothetical protein